MFSMVDHLALMNVPMEALKRSATVTSFDPMTLLPALAVATEHIVRISVMVISRFGERDQSGRWCCAVT